MISVELMNAGLTTIGTNAGIGSAVGLEATINFPTAGGDKRLDLTLAPLTPVA